MAKIQCKMCGGKLELPDGVTAGECPYCGTMTTFPKLADDRQEQLYNRAEHFRRICDFDKAVSCYEELVRQMPEDAEAYWGLVLSRYGIEYVEDPATHERIPTCHRVQLESILADPDYRQALELAAGSDRDLYEQQANRIAEIQKDILRISGQEKPYDVFICYKETTDGGTRTPDSVVAQDIYYQLTNEGYKVFFARITLEDKLGTQYEPYIFAALHSAKVMLAIGTKKEHFEAVWVKNEWSRFLALMKKDRSKMLIPCYRDMDAYDIPQELSMLQSQDMSKIGFIQDLLRGVKKVIGGAAASPGAAAAPAAAKTGKNNPKLKRVRLFLENGDFDKAREYCEQVLDAEPENGYAYFLRLMAEKKLHEEDRLTRLPDLEQEKSFALARRFADPELTAKLDGILNRIREAEEKARQAKEEARRQAEENAREWAEKSARRAQEEERKRAEEARLREKEARRQGRIEWLEEHLAAEAALNGADSVLCQNLRRQLEAENAYRPEDDPSDAAEARVREATERLLSEAGDLDAKWQKIARRKKMRRAVVACGIAMVLLVSYLIFILPVQRRAAELARNGLTAEATVITKFDNSVSSCVIPVWATEIGEGAFNGGTQLTSVTIPNSVTTIGKEAFKGCTGLASVTIPNSVTTIGDFAFSGCTGLTSVTIPNSVTAIGKEAFKGCTGLTSVTIPNSVTEIGKGVFDGCAGLTITIPGNKNKLFKASGVSRIALAPGTTEIENKAFEGWEGLNSVIIPDSVTKIGSEAFKGCTGLTSVTIPNGVTQIDNDAFFRCTGLTSVTIPDSVTTIGDGAFCGCTGLTSVTIPASVAEIGRSAFEGCTKLTNVSIPNGVKEIGLYAFCWCTGLTSVTIPNSVTKIGSCAFCGCTGLTSVTIPASVTEIGRSAFEGCTKLTNVTIPNSVTEIGEGAFKGCTGLTITIPGNKNKLFKASGMPRAALASGTTEIEDKAFEGWRYLISITIPDGVTKIGSEAFNGCTGLTSVTIPNSVTEIGKGAFKGCIGLTSITIPGNKINLFKDFSVSHIALAPGTAEIEDKAFKGWKGLISITIPDGVTKIGSEAFKGCTGLTSMTIPDSVTEIGSEAFSCTGLTSITIPDSVTKIGAGAFDMVGKVIVAKDNAFFRSDRSGVLFDRAKQRLLHMPKDFSGTYIIPNSVKEIDAGAFSWCDRLTSVTIPNSVTKIGAGAFVGVGKVIVAKDNAFFRSDRSGVLFDRAKQRLLYMPKDFSGTYIIPNSVKEIDAGAFRRCDRLTSVTIPNSVKEIDAGAFSWCDRLTSVTIPDSVTKIGNSAFSWCTELTSVTIPDSVKEIGARAFQDCTGLTSITIPNSVTTIGDEAFSRCKGLTSVTIPNSVTKIGAGAFDMVGKVIVAKDNAFFRSDRSGVLFDRAKQRLLHMAGVFSGTYIIPNSVKEIDAGAFSGCTGLTGVTIPNGVTKIGDWAFFGCTGLTSITIPNSVTEIGEGAFSWCKGLTSVTIPNSVTKIGTGAFGGVGKVTVAEDSAFFCSDRSGVLFDRAKQRLLHMPKDFSGTYIIPNSVTEIGKEAFSGCTGLTGVIIPDSVTEIGKEAFSECTGLTGVKIPNSVTKIGARAFSWCKGLTSVTIPNSVTEIGAWAFSDCTGLTSVTIPDSVTKIGDMAFSMCTGLTSVTIPNSVKEIGKGVFAGCKKLPEIRKSRQETPAPRSWTLRLPGNVSLELVGIKAGTFTMGSPVYEIGRYGNEPRHLVTLTQDFYLGRTEVTQRQWKAVMGNNPSHFKGDDLPVEGVSWYDAMRFCERLNKMGFAPAGWKFTLPTEAQWEYACRAGTGTALNNGKDLTSEDGACANLDEVGWYGKNSGGTTHAVGQKRPNAWGLYDMHGNVWEWCRDWDGDNGGDATDPTGPASGSMRVNRGGGWNGYAKDCRSAFRGRYASGASNLGFRLALVPVQ